MSGQSLDESRRVFYLMEQFNWVVGFPSSGGITFKLTDPGNNALANLTRSGIAAIRIDLPEEQLAMVSDIGGNNVFVVHSDSLSAKGLAKRVQEFISAFPTPVSHRIPCSRVHSRDIGV